MPEKVLTTSGGQLVTEDLIETLTENVSSSSPATSDQAIVATPVSTIATSSVPPVPAATPSQAMIIYRRDVCGESRGAQCISTALEFDISPGQSVETCQGRTNYQAPNYTKLYPQYEGGVTKNYAINIGPFSTHNMADCWYNATNDVVGKVDCPGDLFQAQGVLPTAISERCGLATDTPIMYAEW